MEILSAFGPTFLWLEGPLSAQGAAQQGVPASGDWPCRRDRTRTIVVNSKDGRGPAVVLAGGVRGGPSQLNS